MLQAQVNYWSLMEQQRHNLAQEKLGFDTLGETTRHNTVNESVDLGKLSETIRHDTQTERINWANLAEVVRHNKRSESLGYYGAATDRLNAYTRQGELDLKERQYGYDVFSGSQERDIDRGNLEVNQQKADTSEYEAETHRQSMWYNLIGDVVKTGANIILHKNRGGSKK